MSGTLYTYPNNFRANKILIAAEYSGQKVTVDPKFVAGETDKSPEFLKKFPFGKVPAYECGDVRLFQTNAIAHFVGNSQTRGGEKEAEVLQWIAFADNVLQPAACTWVYPTMGILQYNKQNTEKAKSEIKTALTVLNDYLATRTFLVGERVTQADISVACTLCMLYEHVMEPSFREPFGNVNRWFVTLVNQTQFKSVLGEFTLCSKMAQFDAKKYGEIHGKGDKKDKGQKQKQSGGAGDTKSKPKKVEKKEEPKEAPKPAEKKDPWAGLPETKYDMDEWKRTFSNDKSKDKEDSLKYFWDKFDKEKYSIWHCKYRYNEDFRQSFMAGNLIGGMYQRLEKMRKHAFGCCMVWEDGKKFIKIDGLWFWRGQGLAFELCEDWQIDYESYEWIKLDPECEKTKEMVKFYFSESENNPPFEQMDSRVYK